ncbi:MAG: hypothetical protein KGJ85_10390, partial [Betaproteobacteria bacterium]|nr:hypothetical protein [Betaproteobacteria bacterium]
MMKQVRFLPRLARLLLAALGAIVLTACGGGADAFSIGGSLRGLAAGEQVTLLDNGGDMLILVGNGAFSFATQVAYNGSYAVTVATQPAGKVCTVGGGSGAGVIANVSSVSVVCSTNTFTVGGSLSGLAAGQQVTLLDNGGDALTLTADGNFSFATPVAFNGSYAVTVSTAPTGEVCTVGSGSGSGVTANVGHVSVVCSATSFSVGGSLSGLAAGQQVTLLDNGGDALALTAGGSFNFATSVAYGSSYAVTVGTQPTGQTCTVANGSGSSVHAAVSNVTVSCTTNTYTIGGTLTGLAAGQQITLLDSGGDALTLSADGSFSFATTVAYGGSYAVTIGTQPMGQACTVSSGSGSSVSANVSGVAVSCTTNTYTIGGTLTGLAAGQQITLMDNGGDALTLAADGNFSFATRVAYGGSYAVTVGTQPAGQTCVLSNASGSGVSANVAAVQVSCVSYTVSGTLSGLAAGQQLSLLDNGGDAVILTADGSFSFPTPVAADGSYRVTVGTQPSGETCSVNNGVGYGMDANVTQVLVLCSSTGTYRVTGSV